MRFILKKNLTDEGKKQLMSQADQSESKNNFARKLLYFWKVGLMTSSAFGSVLSSF